MWERQFATQTVHADSDFHPSMKTQSGFARSKRQKHVKAMLRPTDIRYQIKVRDSKNIQRWSTTYHWSDCILCSHALSRLRYLKTLILQLPMCISMTENICTIFLFCKLYWKVISEHCKYSYTWIRVRSLKSKKTALDIVDEKLHHWTWAKGQVLYTIQDMLVLGYPLVLIWGG